MKAWLLSMIGVVVLLAIAEMLLPEGKLRKSIRGIFSLILMLVILKPLPKLKDADFNFNFEIRKDNRLSDSLRQKKEAALIRGGEEYLKAKGLTARIELIGDWENEKYVIVSIVVKSKENRYDLLEHISAYYGIKKENILVQREWEDK